MFYNKTNNIKLIQIIKYKFDKNSQQTEEKIGRKLSYSSI